jgi:hypothetical protein
MDFTFMNCEDPQRSYGIIREAKHLGNVAFAP